MSDLTSRLAQLTPEQRARLAARVSAARAHDVPEDAIAIIGMGCRFPGSSNSPEAFWTLLANGVDAVTPVPADRWDGEAFFDADADVPGKIVSREGAFIDRVGDFDAEYFGIAPFEARQMDPQQRIFLEVAVEALEAAGQTRQQLAGSACGVFVGVHSQSAEYYQMQLAQVDGIDTYTSTGTAHSVIANRLSYYLDLRGPSMAIDTACSSSLVALHQACLSLRAGESTLAVAGGLNLMIAPEGSVALSRLRVLSPGGRCRTFDASADGIARGEGCGAVVLKRVRDALRDGDPMLAVIRGSAVNQDGATNGLTAPSTPSQIAVIRSALASATLAPTRVTFVETHGTGTSLGDPIEVDAIAATYGVPRDTGDAVVLGALKTNIGHLEGAAGIASVIKTVLCLQHKRIPRNLHFAARNPLVRLDGTSIELATAARDWMPAHGSRIGAVSSFGFGGTNAHVIIEEVPAEFVGAAPASRDVAAPLPLVLSARTEKALTAQVYRWRGALRGELASQAPLDVAYSASVRRSHHPWRAAVSAPTLAGWADRLDAWVRVTDRERLQPPREGERRKVAFAFCGQGPQWYAMGRDLAAAEPVFRAVLERVAAAVQRVAGWDLLAELASDEATSRIHETEVTQPAMFAIQMGLVALWRSWGVEPDFVIGHSMGEIAAACTAGAIDLEEGARIAVFRGQAVRQAEGLGLMVALPISAAAAAAAIAGLEDRVGIAAVNAPESVVIAGDAASLALVTDALKADGVEGKLLEVRYASHSPQMEPLVGWLRSALGTVAHRAPTLPMFSSISHGLVDRAMLDASHWAVGLRQSVDFSGGVRAALDDGCRVFVDIAPHPVMAGYTRECADAAGVEIATIVSLRRTVGAREQLLQSLGELYEAGVNPDWAAVLGARGRVVTLPSYQWQHVHYWLSAPSASSAPRALPAATVGELHDVRWIPAPASAPRTPLPAAFTVLGGPAALVSAVAARLAERTGVPCATISADDDAAVAAAMQSGAEVIDLRALDPAPEASLSAAATGRTIAAQQLLSTATAPVWLVTRGAVATGDGAVPDAAQAAIWGLGRVAAMEMPSTLAGLIDLASADPAQQSAEAIVDAVTQASNEFEGAVRAGRRLVPRLHPLRVNVAQPVLRSDGYYVVAGGLGGVGREVSHWLVAHGAVRLVLLGRTALPPRERWSDATVDAGTQARIAAVLQLEAQGAEVRTVAVDVSDAAALGRVAAECTAAGWGTARGMLHCATDVQFGLIPELTADAVASMMRSKIGGAESLLQAFGSDVPDFVVLFSSMAAWLGERGQGAYAAANAVLDAWALAQQRAGVPMSVINWGAWERTGLAASRGGELVTDGLRRRGVLAVPPAAATAALGAVIAQRVASATVFRAGTAELAPQGRDPWSVLRDLPGSARVAAETVTVSVPDELRALTETRARVSRLTAVVRGVIADTLGLDASQIDVDQPLGPLGMDSLMAIRIRRRCESVLGLTLPATTLFSYPTVASLTGMLLERLGLDIGEAAATRTATPTAAMAGGPVSPSAMSLSDDEALAALRTRRPAPRRGSA